MLPKEGRTYKANVARLLRERGPADLLTGPVSCGSVPTRPTAASVT